MTKPQQSNDIARRMEKLCEAWTAGEMATAGGSQVSIPSVPIVHVTVTYDVLNTVDVDMKVDVTGTTVGDVTGTTVVEVTGNTVVEVTGTTVVEVTETTLVDVIV